MPRMKISVSVSEEAAVNLRAIAKRSHMNPSRVVDALLLEAKGATLRVSVVKRVRRVR
jgi:hypothetical protein